LLYEPAHSYKAAWSVPCVNSDRSALAILIKAVIAMILTMFNDMKRYVPYSPHSENVAYDPDSMAVQLDINGIYYIAFTASFGYQRIYYVLGVAAHSKQYRKCS
jgi:hypothetical protein